jgi:hypothetical protein
MVLQNNSKTQIGRLVSVALASLVLAVAARGANVTIAWDSPTNNDDGSSLTDLAGYNVHWGTASGTYDQHLNAGLATSATITDLAEGGTYFISVTAYNADGRESILASEVNLAIPITAPEVVMTSPLPAEAVRPRLTVRVAWQSTSPLGSVRIELWRGAQSVCVLQDAVAADSSSMSVDCIVPGETLPGNDYHVRVVSEQAGLSVPSAEFIVLNQCPSDFDSDGVTDVATYDTRNARWRVVRSSDGKTEVTGFGASGDIAVPADYDGDGVLDLAVFRPSTATWHVFGSTVGEMTPVQFGADGDLPVPGDFDADGLADLALYRPSNMTWYLHCTTLGALTPIQFGGPGDLPVPGDYDADGILDPGVYRPSTATWYIFCSTIGPMEPVQFGAAGDLPVSGDYDGDGINDFAVYRPTTKEWFIFGSTAGPVAPFVFGGKTQVPIGYYGE